MEERIARIEGIVEQMDKRLNHIESEIVGLRGEIGGLRRDIREDFEGFKRDIREDFEGLRGEFEGFKRDIREDFKGLRGEFETFEKEDFEGFKKDTKEDFGGLRRELNELRGDVRRIEGIVEQMDKRLTNIEREMVELRGYIEMTTTELRRDIKSNFRWTLGLLISMWISIILTILFRP